LLIVLAALAIDWRPPAADVGPRLRASAEAAQRLQGPLDGAWTLRDRRGRRLFALQITDPAGGGPLAGAWRTLGSAPAAGLLDKIDHDDGDLLIAFSLEAGDPITLRLRRRATNLWLGSLQTRGTTRSVRLGRGG
jgi:hypothetical protein